MNNENGTERKSESIFHAHIIHIEVFCPVTSILAVNVRYTRYESHV